MSDKYCPTHTHVKLPGGIGCCYICEHRSSYMVRGSVELFDKGYKDGFAGAKSRVEAQSSHQAKADYEDGYKHGTAERERINPSRKRFKITIEIGATPMLTGFVYIEAKSVKKISHERIEADGVVIDLPGDIKTVKSRGRVNGKHGDLNSAPGALAAPGECRECGKPCSTGSDYCDPCYNKLYPAKV